MRTVIMFVLLSASMAAAARDLFVVVYTRDTEVTEYHCVCASGSNVIERARQVVRSKGSVSWHAVGGVAPYTVIDQVIDAYGLVSVTVLDAAGNVATGTGIIGTQRLEVNVPCPEQKAPCQLGMTTMKRVDQRDQAPSARLAKPHGPIAPRERPSELSRPEDRDPQPERTPAVRSVVGPMRGSSHAVAKSMSSK